MDTNVWIERLYADEGIVGGLSDEHAEALLSWTESQLAVCETDAEARHLLDTVRLIGRYVQAGGSFEQLLAALKTHALPHPIDGGDTAEALDPTTSAVYPPTD